ncbi:hypothetical protein LCGC14_0275730 [marine sediment metagenome]|uniref:Uncharacterized protein n=1 Tax=marine sediment metagenome TaxID=412755 RepID=A0A0F9UEK9_9ZZZZ
MLELFAGCTLAAVSLTMTIHTLRRSPRVLNQYQIFMVFLSLASLMGSLAMIALIVLRRV